MKLKINKACDLASISVLPPRKARGSGGGGTSKSASVAAAAAVAASQQRSQSMSQQSFSQRGGGSFSQSVGASFSQGGGASFSQGRGGGGALFSQGSGGGGAAFSQGGGGGGDSFSQGGGGGGAAFSQVGGGAGAGAALSQGGGGRAPEFSQGGGGGGGSFSQGGGGGGAVFSQGGGSASLLHSQSQISLASPARDQRFPLHDDSSKRMSSFPANSASCVRDESQLQLTKISSNTIHRWNASLPDSRCQINEDVERKFQHVASSVHKMGMVIDSVQNDVMQLNRAMKEASLDSGSIQKKFVLVETFLQQILKGQDDLKALIEGITKSNPNQTSVLNSHTSKLDEISSTLSVFKQVQEDLRQLKGDIFRIFTKEMEGIVGAIRLLNSRHDAMQVQTHQSCTANGKSPMNQTSVESPLANQRPTADGKQTPVADGRPQKKRGRPRKNQTPVANGRPKRKQAAVANGRPKRKQAAVANGRAQMNHAQMENGISEMNQAPEANGKPTTEQVPATEVLQARKQEEATMIQKFNPQVATTKSLIIDLDDVEEEGTDGSAACVILKTVTGARGELTNGEEAMNEDAMEILRRARKRRRREDVVLFDRVLTGTRGQAQRVEEVN